MEAPFDPAVCLDWWRRKWALGVQHPPTWPEVAQEWFDQHLTRKRIAARIFVKQLIARKRQQSKIVPIRQATRAYRVLHWPDLFANFPKE